MNNTGANNEYALNDFALYNAPTTYQLNAETAAALELLEVTPLRTLVRAQGELGNVAGFDYRQDTTVYSSGKLYNRMQFTNNTGGPLSTYQVNWYGGADYSVNWLGLTDPEGTLSDATEPNAYTDDYALKYADAASPGDEHFGNILFIPSRDYSEFSETGWEWKNDSGDDGGHIKLIGTETFGVGGGITVTHNTVLKPDTIESIAEARPFADDYRLPDVLNVTTGSEWFHASENTSSPSDAFNEAEGAYTLDFDPINGLVFDIDGGTTERRLPVHKIRQWRSLGGASSVSFTGTQTAWEVETQTGDPTPSASNNGVLETHRVLIKQPFVVRGGSAFRVKLRGHTTLPAPGLANFHIAEVDPGDDRVVVDATWTQVTFSGGSTTVSLAAGGSVWSDWITFNLDPAKTYSLTFFLPVNSASSEWIGCSGCGTQKYLTVGSDSSAILDWSGIPPATSTRIDFVEELEVRGTVPLDSSDFQSAVKPFARSYFCDPACETLAHGGLTTDNVEYLASPSRNYPMTFSGSDTVYFATDAQFRGINVSLAVPGVGSADLQWQYWNGGSWANLEAVAGFTDQTSSFTADGTIFWTDDPASWSTTSVNGSPELYYVRAQLASGSYTTHPTERLLKTDILLFRYCGNLVQDTQQFDFAVPVPTAVELESFTARSAAGTTSCSSGVPAPSSTTWASSSIALRRPAGRSNALPRIRFLDWDRRPSVRRTATSTERSSQARTTTSWKYRYIRRGGTPWTGHGVVHRSHGGNPGRARSCIRG